MLPLVNDLNGKKVPVVTVHRSEVECILSLVPREEGAVLTIPNIIHSLNPLTMPFMSLQKGETLVNEFQALRLSNVRV